MYDWPKIKKHDLKTLSLFLSLFHYVCSQYLTATLFSTCLPNELLIANSSVFQLVLVDSLATLKGQWFTCASARHKGANTLCVLLVSSISVHCMAINRKRTSLLDVITLTQADIQSVTSNCHCCSGCFSLVNLHKCRRFRLPFKKPALALSSSHCQTLKRRTHSLGVTTWKTISRADH